MYLYWLQYSYTQYLCVVILFRTILRVACSFPIIQVINWINPHFSGATNSIQNDILGSVRRNLSKSILGKRIQSKSQTSQEIPHMIICPPSPISFVTQSLQSSISTVTNLLNSPSTYGFNIIPMLGLLLLILPFLYSGNTLSILNVCNDPSSYVPCVCRVATKCVWYVVKALEVIPHAPFASLCMGMHHQVSVLAYPQMCVMIPHLMSHVYVE